MLHALREIAAIARVHDAPAPAVLPSLPFTWGPLEARAFIARGAHGDVYRAWDPRLEREVALKLLRSENGDADGSFAIAEGRLLARVQHPNVVAVFGADRVNGQAGIWMELVEGGTVRELVASGGPLTAQGASEIGMAVCAGLGAIHAAGLVHRDIKAQNVVRSRDGRTILMDLSVGQDVADDGEGLEGTPVYLAPELLNGGRATVASDIYATGVLLFFLVTGQYPVTATSLEDLRRRHRAGSAERLAATRGVSRQFSMVVNRALATNPGDRYTSADELRSALSAALTTRRRLSGVMIAATVVLAAGVGAGALVLTSGERTPNAPLAAIAAGASSQMASPRRIRTPDATMGRPRADGTEFPYVDADGHLHIWDVATGRSRLVAEANPTAGTGRVAAMSESGDQVAFGWRLPDGAFELRVVSRDGSAVRTLIPRVTAYEAEPVDWSRDGRSILCWLHQRNGTTDLVLVPTERGSPHLLHSLPSGRSAYASLSPDGRLVLLSASFSADSPQGMRIIETSGSEPRVLLETAAVERLARWTPDGAHIYFLRDSPTVPVSRDAWMVAVQDGVLTGEPWLAAPDLGTVSALWWTPDGEMLRLVSTISADVYTAAFDLSGDTAPGPPTRIDPVEIGNHVAPSWSPDGRSLAYFTTVARAPGATPSRTLTIKDMVSGHTRQVPVPLLFVSGYTPRWSPDGRHVMILGRNEDRGESFAYFQVTIDTGELAPVATLGSAGPAHAQYSGDGRHFYYVHPPRGLVARDLSTGVEQVTIGKGHRSGLGPFAIAPDGQTIAFIGATETKGRQVTALEVQPFDGTPRELVRAVEPAYVSLQAWTPDSQALLIARGAGATPYQLWRIPAGGGPLTDMRFSLIPSPSGISLRPDGQRIAYTERFMQQELWITDESRTLSGLANSGVFPR